MEGTRKYGRIDMNDISRRMYLCFNVLMFVHRGKVVECGKLSF